MVLKLNYIDFTFVVRQFQSRPAYYGGTKVVFFAEKVPSIIIFFFAIIKTMKAGKTFSLSETQTQHSVEEVSFPTFCTNVELSQQIRLQITNHKSKSTDYF